MIGSMLLVFQEGSSTLQIWKSAPTLRIRHSHLVSAEYGIFFGSEGSLLIMHDCAFLEYANAPFDVLIALFQAGTFVSDTPLLWIMIAY